MFAEEETELRDLIIQNLESCGFLNKIKAELRAGVFLALEEDGNLRTKVPLFNKKFDDFIETSDGKIIVSIVREFLEYFNLNFTLSVFDPEIASSSSPCYNRSDLCDKLKLENTKFDGPVILALLKTTNGKQSEKGKIPNLSPDFFEKHAIASSDSVKSNLVNDILSKEKDKSDTFLSREISAVTNDVANELADDSEMCMKDKGNKKPFIGEIYAKDLFETKSATKKDLLDTTFDKPNAEEKSSINTFFKDTTTISSLDHDPFFDEPLPAEKSPYFSIPTEKGLGSFDFKDGIGKKDPANVKNESLVSEKGSLSCLKDLPSLTSKSTNWTFNNESKSALPSLESVKSGSEHSNEEINLNARVSSNVKNTDNTESNEDLSDNKLNSEESIEEELEEDFSAGIDDLLNSSLSLGDDATTDHTISQASIIEGVDHVETCNSTK
ncbi:centrosomal protein 43-like [Stegodyphus dumicola]|uniref:centrosomal protein 43-like n=1 Tax=Stegodyphus dumicola TaxID=202533 RepID=UPI0015A79B1D|nr:centrosomal protein 43-like [Stegodyphus dumicola]